MDGDTGAPPLGSSMPAVPLAADGDPALGARGAARLRRAQIRREIELCYRQRVTQIVLARRSAAEQYAELHLPLDLPMFIVADDGSPIFVDDGRPRVTNR